MQPTYDDIMALVDRAMWEPEILEAVGRFVRLADIPEEYGTEMHDLIHLAVVAGMTLTVEMACGEGTIDRILDAHMDDELSKILSAGE